MHLVVAFRKLERHLDEAQANHLEALALEASQDLTDQPALDSIGLDQDQSALE
jgi:hypothetical protein